MVAQVVEPDVRRLLAVHLEDSRASVRKAALTALERLALQDAELQELIVARLDDAAVAVRCAAVLAAGRACEGSRVVDQLGGFMQEADQSLQAAWR